MDTTTVPRDANHSEPGYLWDERLQAYVRREQVPMEAPRPRVWSPIEFVAMAGILGLTLAMVALIVAGLIAYVMVR